jgi:dienelactone hydrolase
MGDRITIKGRDGASGAYLARPAALPAPAVVVLQEVFGVNADIRETCDELAGQGFLAIAPDLFWRQEPGVDLGVTSEVVRRRLPSLLKGDLHLLGGDIDLAFELCDGLVDVGVASELVT